MNSSQYQLKKANDRREKDFKRQLKQRRINLETITAEGIENAKKTIILIEKFCFALNQITAPLRFSEDLIKGFGLVNTMHTQLLEQIGPEEVEKMRQEYKTNVPPPIKPQPSEVN